MCSRIDVCLCWTTLAFTLQRLWQPREPLVLLSCCSSHIQLH